MIQNLLTSGCSFTAGMKAWPTHTQKALKISKLINQGASGAGNRYIANSIIDTIEYYKLQPDSTLVMVMWSGAARCDHLVAGDYWNRLMDYSWKARLRNGSDSYWLFSGGRSNSWVDHKETFKLFQPYYLTSDPYSLCQTTLENISKLQNYLENHGFRYRFLSYANCWIDSIEFTVNGDYSLGFFAKNQLGFQNLKFTDWIFCNSQQDSMYEFCKQNNLLHTDNFHPSEQGHFKFVEQIIIPQLQDLEL